MQRVAEWAAEDSLSGERAEQTFLSKVVGEAGIPWQLDSL